MLELTWDVARRAHVLSDEIPAFRRKAGKINLEHIFFGYSYFIKDNLRAPDEALTEVY